MKSNYLFPHLFEFGGLSASEMVEHEIHHRGQLYLYLGMLGVPTQPIFGLTSEQVRSVGASD